MAEDLESQVKEIIADQLQVDKEELTADASFKEDLGADSLDTVEVIMAFEGEFDIDIQGEDEEEITTVGGAIDYLEKVLEGK